MRFSNLFKATALFLAGATVLLGFGACARQTPVEQPTTGGENPPVTANKPTIKLIEGDWTSQIVGTEIMAQIIEKQLGYSVEKVQTSVTAGWAAMSRGDADFGAEAWLPGRLTELQPFMDKGEIELGSVTFPGDSGWFVPKFVIDGDPSRGIQPLASDLKSILDLQTLEKGGKGYWKIFENPENPGTGELVGGDPGWYDDAFDRMRIKGYDLPLTRSNQAEAIMAARMIAADKKGAPLLIYMWKPHWIFSVVDLVKLEEPNPWFEGAFEDETQGYKAAYPPTTVYTVIASRLKSTAPDVYSLMKNFALGEEHASALMLRVDVDNEDIPAVATDWISKNQSLIDQWLGK